MSFKHWEIREIEFIKRLARNSSFLAALSTAFPLQKNGSKLTALCIKPQLLAQLTFMSLRFIWFHEALRFSNYTEYKKSICSVSHSPAPQKHRQISSLQLPSQPEACSEPVCEHQKLGSCNPAATLCLLMKLVLLDTSFQPTALHDVKETEKELTQILQVALSIEF